ncbi:MAG: hypothetical protein ACE5NA_03470, partial [Nitrospiraceae bacterium]
MDLVIGLRFGGQASLRTVLLPLGAYAIRNGDFLTNTLTILLRTCGVNLNEDFLITNLTTSL